jgi:hypothetical protein
MRRLARDMGLMHRTFFAGFGVSAGDPLFRQCQQSEERQSMPSSRRLRGGRQSWKWVTASIVRAEISPGDRNRPRKCRGGSRI